MLELYHQFLSTCSQKVRLVLAEKGLEWTSHDVDLVNGGQHDPAYVKLNPNHVVPTLIHDGRAFIESTLINEYLDDAFPERALKPVDAAGRHAMRLWTKRIDELHPSAGVLTYAIGTRPMLLQQPREKIEANVAQIPDPVRRAQRMSVIDHGVKAPEFGGALQRFIAVLDALEAPLGQHAWVAGENFSLADASVLPYVLRMDHLAMGSLFGANVKRWYRDIQARPSFETAITARIPEPVLAMFRKNGEEAWPDVRALLEGGTK